MHLNYYDPKVLLSTLIEVETILTSTMEEQCPSSEMSFSEDLDKALDDFLQIRDVDENEVGYLSSQLALLHLLREIDKTIQIVVESNNLRAYNDFRKYMDTSPQESAADRKIAKEVFCGFVLVFILGFVSAFCILWLFEF